MSAAHWRVDSGTWICVAALMLCLGALASVPGWWRGTYDSGRSLGRQRTYLVQWAGSAFLMIGALIATLLPGGDQMSLGQAWFGLAPMIIGASLVLLIPLVWHVAAFEFLVPPSLRRGVPGGPPGFRPRRPQNAPQRAPTRKPATNGPGRGGTLRIGRPKGGWRDRFVGYRVEVDGGEVGSLRSGAELTIPVAAGTHTVRGTVHFTGSPTVRVQVRAGETTVVCVRPGSGNPLVQVAAPDSYLTIEVIDE